MTDLSTSSKRNLLTARSPNAQPPRQPGNQVPAFASSVATSDLKYVNCAITFNRILFGLVVCYRAPDAVSVPSALRVACSNPTFFQFLTFFTSYFPFPASFPFFSSLDVALIELWRCPVTDGQLDRLDDMSQICISFSDSLPVRTGVQLADLEASRGARLMSASCNLCNPTEGGSYPVTLVIL